MGRRSVTSADEDGPSSRTPSLLVGDGSLLFIRIGQQIGLGLLQESLLVRILHHLQLLLLLDHGRIWHRHWLLGHDWIGHHHWLLDHGWIGLLLIRNWNENRLTWPIASGCKRLLGSRADRHLLLLLLWLIGYSWLLSRILYLRREDWRRLLLWYIIQCEGLLDHRDRRNRRLLLLLDSCSGGFLHRHLLLLIWNHLLLFRRIESEARLLGRHSRLLRLGRRRRRDLLRRYRFGFNSSGSFRIRCHVFNLRK